MWATRKKDKNMKLFTPELYRNFGIGFAAGAVVAAMANGGALLAAVPQFLATIF